jgi:predicted nuclease of restriction endonuclease-like (RecB) superfamily
MNTENLNGRPSQPADEQLFGDVTSLIEGARRRAAAAVNSELVMLYWSIGKRIREDVLGGERAEYGREILERLGQRLTARYGQGYSRRNLARMLQFAELYPDLEIWPPVAAQLTWTNIVELLTIDEQPKRDFYLAMCAHEHWTKRTLRAKIADKLFERTIDARGSVNGLEVEIAALREGGVTTPGLAFRDPYVLDFLGLDAKHSEADLERAILDEMQRFLLELGADFAFVARQKRIVVDGEDYYLDLLFFHRGMRCLVAVELKTRKLQPGDKGQMELYLRWLDAHERRQGEEPPIGLILCASKGPQQTALLGLDHGEIRAAQYLTQPMREEMQRRLMAATLEIERSEAAGDAPAE